MDETTDTQAVMAELLAGYRGQVIAGSAVAGVPALHGLVAGESKVALDAALARTVAIYGEVRASLTSTAPSVPAVNVVRQEQTAPWPLGAAAKIGLALRRGR